MGIGDSLDASAKEYAFSVRNYVDAYSISLKRQSDDQLSEATSILRRRTGKPISITATYRAYFVESRTPYGEIVDALNEELIAIQDWIFVGTTYAGNVRELVEMDSRFHGFPQRERRVVMYRRIPVPWSELESYEETQKNSYQTLIEETDVVFVFNEAFDQDTSSSYGLFTWNRKPKKVIEYLTKPQIVFTNRTWHGDLHLMKGKVLNCSNPKDYKIFTQITVGGRWWNKPYDAYPTVPIEEDFSWQVPIITGGIDERCTEVKVYLVKSEYDPRYKSWLKSSDMIATSRIIREERTQ